MESVIVLIKPIATATNNGSKAQVTGIDVVSGDPFVGMVEFEPGRTQTVRW